ncbi:RRM 2 domain-containing protein [Abeliophyllum distichum]|uniref:RRM 2 domain-containing protein n=1 Tax=Abeliophyllum distichum TaxID=126358 RepID=A0ABD1TKG6_9LAMI
MCLKPCKPCPLSSNSLNPKAEEWRPPQSQPSAPLPPQLVAYTTAAHQVPKQPCYHTLTVPSHQCFLPYEAYPPPKPFYLPPFSLFRPDYGYLIYTATSAVSFDENNVLETGIKVNHEEDLKSPCNINKMKLQSSKGTRNFLPPRILMARRACKKLGRQEWRPRNAKSEHGLLVTVGNVVSSRPTSLSIQDFSLSGKTTVMIKNIPNQFRRDDMLKYLDQRCQAYSLEYDFFYLPMDFRSKDNLGYAFVNFTTAVAAVKAMEILQNYHWGTIQTCKGTFVSKKICEVTPARIQGKKNLVARFQNSIFSCDGLDFLPVVFDPPRNGSKPNSEEVVVGRLKAIALCKMMK